MNRLFLALCLTFAAFAHAAPTEQARIANMVAQCDAVMQSGVCRVALDPKDYLNATILVAGVGRINTASYLRIRATGEARNPDGTYKMCVIVRDACVSWDGDDCKAARALWKQAAP